MGGIIRKHCGCFMSTDGTTLKACAHHKKPSTLIELATRRADEIAAERRGFIKGLEAARRAVRAARRSDHPVWNFDAVNAITARIKREKAKR